MKNFHHIVSKVLKIKEECIHDTLSPADVENWDSVNALLLVAGLENAFNIKFEWEDVVNVTCIGDIKNVLRKHGVDVN